MPNTPLRSSGLVSKDFHLTESVETALQLSEKQASALDALGKELSRSKAWWGSTVSEEPVDRRVIEVRMRSRGQYLCTIRNAVGVVEVGGIRIFSKPKIPMEHFVYIAKHSFLGDGRTANNETSVGDGQSFLDLIALWFVNSAMAILRQGLSLDYELRTDPIRYATGRIDPVRTSLNLLKGNIEVQSEYQERTPNSPENRIMASAIKLVSPDLLGTPELSRSVAQLRREFQGIRCFSRRKRPFQRGRVGAGFALGTSARPIRPGRIRTVARGKALYSGGIGNLGLRGLTASLNRSDEFRRLRLGGELRSVDLDPEPVGPQGVEDVDGIVAINCQKGLPVRWEAGDSSPTGRRSAGEGDRRWLPATRHRIVEEKCSGQRVSWGVPAGNGWRRNSIDTGGEKRFILE